MFRSVGNTKIVHDRCIKTQHKTEKCLNAAEIWFIKSKNTSLHKGALHFCHLSISISQSRLVCVWGKMSTGSHGSYHRENKECMRNRLENIFSGPSLSKATLFPWRRASLWDTKRENYLFLFGWFLFRGFSLHNSPTTKYHVSGYCNSIMFFWEQMSLLWQAKTWLSLEERIQQDVLLSWLVLLLEGA